MQDDLLIIGLMTEEEEGEEEEKGEEKGHSKVGILWVRQLLKHCREMMSGKRTPMPQPSVQVKRWVALCILLNLSTITFSNNFFIFLCIHFTYH